MAAAASGRNVRTVDRRIGGAPGKYLVGTAMAVLAIGGDFAGGDDLRMRAVRRGVLCVGVAVGAHDLLRWRIMRKALHVLVAVHASELHGSMDGALEFLSVDVERNGFAVDLGGQTRIAVAGETIVIFQLVLGANGEGRAQQKERERTEQYSAGNFHA